MPASADWACSNEALAVISCDNEHTWALAAVLDPRLVGGLGTALDSLLQRHGLGRLSLVDSVQFAAGPYVALVDFYGRASVVNNVHELD